MVITLRQANTDDAPACAAIVFDWIERTSWLSGPSYDELLAMIVNGMPDREFWVAGDPVAGYLSLNRETCQVMGLYCRSSGKGVGKALIDRVKEGRDFVQLWSHSANSEAHRFYRREGFVQVDEREKGTDGIAEIKMQWHR